MQWFYGNLVREGLYSVKDGNAENILLWAHPGAPTADEEQKILALTQDLRKLGESKGIEVFSAEGEDIAPFNTVFVFHITVNGHKVTLKAKKTGSFTTVMVIGAVGAVAAPAVYICRTTGSICAYITTLCCMCRAGGTPAEYMAVYDIHAGTPPDTPLTEPLVGTSGGKPSGGGGEESK